MNPICSSDGYPLVLYNYKPTHKVPGHRSLVGLTWYPNVFPDDLSEVTTEGVVERGAHIAHHVQKLKSHGYCHYPKTLRDANGKQYIKLSDGRPKNVPGKLSLVHIGKQSVQGPSWCELNFHMTVIWDLEHFIFPQDPFLNDAIKRHIPFAP